jgi:hypothetical protein
MPGTRNLLCAKIERRWKRLDGYYPHRRRRDFLLLDPIETAALKAAYKVARKDRA